MPDALPNSDRMKLEPQRSPDLARLGELVQDVAVAMMTTAGDDGVLASCPMEALEMDGDGALWFFVDLRNELTERLRSVNITFVDESAGTYVSLSGRGEIAKDAERTQRLWTRFDSAAFADGPNSRHLALLRFVPQRAERWDAPSSRVVRLLALAASAVTGEPVGAADHQVLDDLSARGPAPTAS